MDVRGNVSDLSLIQQLRPHARSSEDFALWVGDGWLPLVAACHEALVAGFPEYELLAVKEKSSRASPSWSGPLRELVAMLRSGSTSQE